MDPERAETDDDELIAAGERATSRMGFLAHPVVPFTKIIVVSGGAGCVLAWLVGSKAIARTTTRELDWLEALPFTVSNQLVLLGSGYATVEITFRASHPNAEDWAKLLQQASDDVLAFAHRAQRGRMLEFSTKTVPALPGGHRIWRAWHAFVERTLVPLHATHAIESVRIRR